MQFNYFYGDEHEQYLFLQLPIMLIKDKCFKKLSDSSKILYSLLLNRTSLSKKNNWIDEQGRIYIIYTIEEIMEDLNCANQKACKLLKELKEVGLIEKKQQGLNKPNILYIKNFATILKYKKEPTNTEPVRKCENHTSRNVKITFQEMLKSDSINIDNNNIDNIYIKSSLSQSKKQNLKQDIDQTQTKNIIQDKKNVYQNFPTAGQSKKEIDKHKHTKKTIINYNTYLEKIKENICYNSVLVFDCKNDISLIDELINNMLDVICSEEAYIYINRQKKATDLIKSMYLKIDCDDFKYIISKFKTIENRISKKSQYIKTLLYNCKLEKNIAYTNIVNNQ